MNDTTRYAHVAPIKRRVAIAAAACLFAVAAGCASNDRSTTRTTEQTRALSTSTSQRGAVPNQSQLSPAVVTGEATPPITVPQRYVGPGRSQSQIVGLIMTRGCLAGTIVTLMPKTRTGRTPVDVTVTGVSGRAAGFRAKQQLWIDNEGDPVLGARELPRLRRGTYLLTAHFNGDALRFPTTFQRVQHIRGCQ